MASLSVRRLDSEVVRRLKIRAERESLSLEETCGASSRAR